MPDTSVLLWSAAGLLRFIAAPASGRYRHQNRSELAFWSCPGLNPPPNRLPTFHRRFRPLTKIRVHITQPSKRLPMLILIIPSAV